MIIIIIFNIILGYFLCQKKDGWWLCVCLCVRVRIFFSRLLVLISWWPETKGGADQTSASGVAAAEHSVLFDGSHMLFIIYFYWNYLSLQYLT